MESIANQQTERRFNIAFISLFFILFLVTPSYYQDNPGGEGLFLPFNNVVWIAVCFIIGLGLLKVIHTGKIHLPGMAKSMLFFLITTTLLGIITSVATPVDWLFRSLAIWGGVLFFFAIAQFRLERPWQENLLIIVAVSTGIQSIYGLIQILAEKLPTWLPQTPGVPMGIFQQANLLASYTATGLILSCFLITLPSIRRRSFATALLILIVIALTTSTVITTGSRGGLLGALAGLLLLTGCRYQQIWNNRKYSVAALLVILLSTVGSLNIPSKTGGLAFSISKFNTMVDNDTSPNLQGLPPAGTARYAIYESSMELIAEKPIWGYGIGQFQRVWHEKKIEYIRQNPNANILPVRLSHPHNELFYWAIEGGLVALSGILTMIGAFLWCCWKIGWQRGGAYLAVLLPITLHSQIELPFYISHLHWILFIVLVGAVAQHQIKLVCVRISSAFKVLALTISLAIPVIGSTFFTHGLLSINRIVLIQFNKVKDFNLLQLASNNLYFSQRATLIQMQVLLHLGLKESNFKLLQKYEIIAKEYLATIPDTAIYSGLISALHKMKRYDESHHVLARLISMYPTSPEVVKFQGQIMALDKKLGIFDKYWKITPDG
ncbi:MAG: Wzy polymerase domain-containing protein [Motiliproteus sp.]|nr:Wzy polymerase domain-containing protein [Motiliproteus sp.]MCW9051115.1 Wzy polymerase domain-containing protein [Motiliproteus sp.]